MTSTPQETSPEVRQSIQAGLDAYLAALAIGMDGESALFTNDFMRLPTSGTLWSPGDALGHYQNWFAYDRLYEAWWLAGRPEETLPVIADDKPTRQTCPDRGALGVGSRLTCSRRPSRLSTSASCLCMP